MVDVGCLLYVQCGVGGYIIADHEQSWCTMMHAGGLLGNWQLVEALKESFCFDAGDYREQLRAAADQPHTAGKWGSGFMTRLEGRDPTECKEVVVCLVLALS
jgi:hypothetical protein